MPFPRPRRIVLISFPGKILFARKQMFEEMSREGGGGGDGRLDRVEDRVVSWRRRFRMATLWWEDRLTYFRWLKDFIRREQEGEGGGSERKSLNNFWMAVVKSLRAHW